MCITRRRFGQTLLGGAATLVTPERAASDDLLGHDVICSLYAYPNYTYTKSVREAPPEAQQAVKLILDSVGMARNFEVLAGTFSAKVGGFATMRNGRRYIVYDEGEYQFGGGRTDWNAMGLMGHEIGHHLGSHLFRSDVSDPDEELEADRFAGFVLGRLGASEDQALLWTDDLNPTATTSHPAQARRRVAAREGWLLSEVVKQRETPNCKPDWLGERFNLDGRQCRLAQTCTGGEARPRLTCEDYLGDWRWITK